MSQIYKKSRSQIFMLKFETGSLFLILIILLINTLLHIPQERPFCFLFALPFHILYFLHHTPPQWTFTRTRARSGPPGQPSNLAPSKIINLAPSVQTYIKQAPTFKFQCKIWLLIFFRSGSLKFKSIGSYFLYAPSRYPQWVLSRVKF